MAVITMQCFHYASNIFVLTIRVLHVTIFFHNAGVSSKEVVLNYVLG